VRVACSTWAGGGNVVAFQALAERLRARGHDVVVQVDHRKAPLLAGDVLLVDHMSSSSTFEAVRASGRPVAALVHTLWSFVPGLEGTFAPAGYLDQLRSLDRLLLCTVESFDGARDVPANAVYVGPVLEPEGPDAGWAPPPRSLVVVSMGTTDMAEAPVLRRVLDALATLPVDVVATVPPHIDRKALRAPANVELLPLTRHAALLPHADLFVGHGGHGGIMAAMAFGVPIVCVPLDRDQPANAARVEAVGAGRTVASDADVATMASVFEAVRTGSREREGVVAMANAIAAYGNAAVEAVESLAR
jgi:UDP:flavonoid glycosyltransferase YjiC (YdhE family)